MKPHRQTDEHQFEPSFGAGIILGIV